MVAQGQTIVDVLSDVLRTLHLSGSLLVRCDLGPPWGLSVSPFDAPVFHALLSGRGWLTLQGRRHATEVAAGDIVVVPHGQAHTLSHALGARTERIVDLASDVGGDPCPTIQRGGPVETELVCGFFRLDRGDIHPLIRSLPPLLHLPASTPGASVDARSTITLIERERASGRPGGGAKLDRLIGVLFIDVILAWIGASGERPTGWIAALQDPQIHEALERIHSDPARSWSLRELAASAKMSRSAFAARFRDLAGQTPMQYVTAWRMQRAAHHLRAGARPVAAVAALAGYESEATFSRAFRRHVGVRPGEYRVRSLKAAEARLPLR